MKTHSTMSRRDFMKALGLGAAGIGAISAATPIFHDLDELMTSEEGIPQKRPWWVKERDLFDPTSEIDWTIMKRFDRNNEAHTRRVNTMYRSAADIDAIAVKKAEIDERRMRNSEPGYDRKWQALYTN